MALLSLLVLLMLTACADPSPEQTTGIQVSEAMGNGNDAGFTRANQARTFLFPADHGPHPDYKNEWWYFTGHLHADSGHRFGFQVTFFRIALAPPDPERPSNWATRQIWMAHAAITDIRAGRHQARERFARDALGLAGAQAEPVRVWLEDWRLTRQETDNTWRLDIPAEDFSLELALTEQHPPLLQGDGGLSQKSAEPGNASYYYSITRLQTQGKLRIAGQEHQVQGLAWLDREWSTSALGPDQAGWDWFSLQLDDGTDIMYYQLRRKDGGVDPHSRGTVRLADGTQVALLADGARLTPVDWWESPSAQRYPIAWEMRIGPLRRDLRIRALVPDQLMDLTVRYWEGAVEVRDVGSDVASGQGYLELAGY